MMSKFKFFCKFMSMGCAEIIDYDKVSKHEETCPYELFQCTECGVSMRISEQDNHDCIVALKLEITKLQQNAKSRILFYSSGGNNKYHIFEEATLDWKSG